MSNKNTPQELPDVADRINRALAAGKTVRALENQRRTPLSGASVQNGVLTGFVRKSDGPRQAWIIDLSRSTIAIGDFTVDEILNEPVKERPVPPKGGSGARGCQSDYLRIKRQTAWSIRHPLLFRFFEFLKKVMPLPRKKP